ncbi:MAG: 16S rRNA (cytosine(1402)-N(4))-methyltransferase RsmH [Myxococcota bacterium]
MEYAKPENFEHVSVMTGEVVRLMGLAPAGVVVDCTVGGSGHSRALLEMFDNVQIVALDRDPAAVAIAEERLRPYGTRARVVHSPFSELSKVLRDLGIEHVSGLLVDLGVSSHQIDSAERGFSFRTLGPLDMRMDPTSGDSAEELLARVGEKELAQAIARFGEERFARRVARAIVAERPKDTLTLANLVRRVVPKSKDGLDPATRTFQGIRMLVNRELDELQMWLEDVPDLLIPGGIAVAISFHSLEDRAVKRAFRSAAHGCTCPPRLPMCACGRLPTLEVLTPRALRPAVDELADNHRARSARLRAARKLGETA